MAAERQWHIIGSELVPSERLQQLLHCFRPDFCLVSLRRHNYSLNGQAATRPWRGAPGVQQPLVDHARISHTFYDRKNAEVGNRLNLAVEQHDQMMEAIDKGDAEQAIAVTLAHWELSRSQAELFVNVEPIPLSDMAS